MSDCLFCKIIAGEIPADKVLDTEDVFAFRDIHPQAQHHILVVPKRHIAKLSDLGPADTDVIGKLMTTVAAIARDLKLDEQGFRVVINNGETAGQSVFHLHAHLLGGRSFRWPPG